MLKSFLQLIQKEKKEKKIKPNSLAGG